MKRPTRRQLFYIAGAAVVLAFLVVAFLPRAVPVETARVSRGPLTVFVEEEGEMRLDRLHVVSAPVQGYARPITLRVGDRVTSGQQLVQLEAPRTPVLDPRTRAEAAAHVTAARAALAEAGIAAEHEISERERLERLLAAGAGTQQALAQATAAAARAVARRDAARAELAAAQAALARASDTGTLPVQATVRAPITGRVLAIHKESGGPVNVGEPLLEIGDIDRLEVAVDVLSQDAVRIHSGTRVLLEQWGGEGDREAPPLEAIVTRVEPRGFTRVSALGVEEQRVTVVADPVSPPTALGPGYRVLARFVIWHGEDVLQVPTSALFRAGDRWALFAVVGNRAERRFVTVGHQAGLAAEIVEGVVEGDVVIVHPGNDVEDGARVDPAGQ